MIRPALARLLTLVLAVTTMAIIAANLAPDTWVRPVIALWYLATGLAVWAMGYTEGRRDR